MNNRRAYAPLEFRGVSTNNRAIKSWRSATTDNTTTLLEKHYGAMGVVVSNVRFDVSEILPP